ncbi:MAG: redoxin domain-containing protein [Pirellulaceae bacterium]|nr:redoxin domain-containing protein [Pirellulaceae bacterium]
MVNTGGLRPLGWTPTLSQLISQKWTRKWTRKWTLVLIGMLASVIGPTTTVWLPAAEPVSVSVAVEYRALVPHRLLALLHAPEVHEELKLSTGQIGELESLFAQVDGVWFRSRILPLDKQFPILDKLEQQVARWMADHLTSQQQERVRQLELQSQSVRVLLRSDVTDELKLSEKQTQKLAELAKATDKAQQELQQALMKQQPATTLQDTVTKAIKAEQDVIKSSLDTVQLRKLTKLVGAPFETAKLERIYPMAPEFDDHQQWLNSKPITLKSLRGKVVLVHFYAFQCHNCHANFAIYKRWHEQLQSKGVVVVGIQTPETSRERDPKAIAEAATEKKLEFPILLDLESKSWNAWANTMWPTVYVVDKQGYIRHWWQGELNWNGATGDQIIEKVVDKALAE